MTSGTSLVASASLVTLFSVYSIVVHIELRCVYERRCVVDAIRGCRLVASAVDEKKIGLGSRDHRWD